MTSLPFKLQIDPLAAQFLFTVRGPMVPATPDEPRLYNMAAGSDQGVAAARSFGDLSHAVYVPVKPEAGTNELLILDYWNSPQGLGMFFSDPQVQQGGTMLFRDKETVIWQASPAPCAAASASPLPTVRTTASPASCAAPSLRATPPRRS